MNFCVTEIPYEVTVWTGDVRGGGTDSNVFLQMYGEYGKTEQTFIRNKTDNFEQGQQDKFKVDVCIYITNLRQKLICKLLITYFLLHCIRIHTASKNPYSFCIYLL